MSQQIYHLPANVLFASGVLKPGWKVKFFLSQTTTPTLAYTSPDLDPGSAATEFTADAAGVMAPIYLDPEVAYKSEVYDQDDVLQPDFGADPVNDSVLSQSVIGALLYPVLQEEGSTVLDGNYPYGYAQRYGFSTSASAAVNSTALQAACDLMYALGGGVVEIPSGTFDTDDPVIVKERVSLHGNGYESTIIRKTTSTASSVSDSTIREWDGATVGAPVCVFHFVDNAGTGNWSYARAEGIQVRGDTSSPNTTTVVYGFFFHGVTGARVHACMAQYVQCGFFWGAGATITSELSGNFARNVQRGFYQHFMTSTSFHHNYVARFRYQGYSLQWYYSSVFANAADNPSSSWKVGTTEVSEAYYLYASKGGEFVGNGCESHNGRVFRTAGNLGVRFAHNVGLDITSDYTGGSDIALWENDSNIGCVYEYNRVQTSGMTGTGARHFIYKIASESGNYRWENNRFVDAVGDNTDTSSWSNISGSIIATLPVRRVPAANLTPTTLGEGSAGTVTYTSQNGRYERIGDTVMFMLRVGWSAHSGTGNLLIDGLPIAAENTESQPVQVLADGLTFSGQLVAAVRPNTTRIELWSMTSGGALSNVAVDAAAIVWISGSYKVAA